MSAEPLLPPLPTPWKTVADADGLPVDVFRAFQVRDFARSAQAAALPVMQWQPIETAPKDGTTVLVGRHMGDFGFIRGYGRFEGTDGAFLSGWISVGFDPVMSNLGLAHPTHWMPLPAPPQNLIEKE